MSSVTPQLAEATIQDFLEEQFNQPVADLALVDSGQIAQTRAFRVDGEAYIVRFATAAMYVHYEKEDYLYRRIASPLIPIPEIVRFGWLRDTPYAISRQLPGTRLDRLPRAEYEHLLPALVETIAAIHAVDTSDTAGAWVFDGQGTGIAKTWRGALRYIYAEEPEWDFFGTWHTLFRDSFLERDVFERVYREMTALLDACPEERALVHTCPGLANVLAEQGRITAVLDWIDAKYGDFVFDIASLDFWSPLDQLPERFARYYAEHGISVPAYAERLQCYRLYQGLDALRFFAKTRNLDAYRWARQRLRDLLDADEVAPHMV
jgi:hygromycin-B 4-O-kinase